jgi:2-polyprenyl-6-methoxyphenol hydroxylase-like FAD-dependent oxidoreductase
MAADAPSRPRYDVVIIGAGMAGCAVAQALARADEGQRRSILLVDLHRDCSPRFSGELIHPRGAQVVDDLGFYEPLRARGAVDVNGFSVLEHAEGQRVDLEYGTLPGRSTGVSVHHKTLVRTMRAVVREQPHVELREGWRAIDVVRDRDQVTGVVLAPAAEAGHERIRVGCDLLVVADG